MEAETGAVKELPGKCSRQLKKGDVLRIETPGGGGWGNDGSQ
jgi:N-methylhydantoinase B/oxoprolinase/acetone carboxylase alpha subunit